MKPVTYALMTNYNLFQINGIPLYLAFLPFSRFRFSVNFLLSFTFLSAMAVISNDYNQSAFFIANVLFAYLLGARGIDIRLFWRIIIISCAFAIFDSVLLGSYVSSLMYVDGNGTHSQLFGFLELFRFGAFFSEPSRLALILVMGLFLLNRYDTIRFSDLFIGLAVILSTVSMSGFLLLTYIGVSHLLKSASSKISLKRLFAFLIICAAVLFVVDTALTVFNNKYVNFTTLLSSEPRFEKINQAIRPLLTGDIFSFPGFFGYANLHGVNTGNWILFWLHDYRLLGVLVIVVLITNLIKKIGMLDTGFFVLFYSLNSENHLIFIAPIVWVLLNEKKFVGNRAALLRYNRDRVNARQPAQ